MIKYSSIIVLLLFSIYSKTISAQSISIIPAPKQFIITGGTFSINHAVECYAPSKESEQVSSFFKNYLNEFYDISLFDAKDASKQSNRIEFIIDKELALAKEAYSVEVNKQNIRVQAATSNGLFYGMQSLIQLLPLTRTKSLSITCCTINDAPRFEYRGLHLDCGRHFMPVSFIKKYLDAMALHKLNSFHWHLTEDQGWRIEIKQYPELVKTASCRAGTIIGNYPGTGNDGIKYCGYYTQDEIREIVQYASDRFITVIPEIEMPGHSSAALAAYPFLGCSGGPYQVQQTWGVFDDVYCAGNDSVFNFLENVLNEVMELFPSKYIHIGGDECPKESWKHCTKCQKRITAEGLKDEHALQSYFIQRIEKYLNSKGRNIIGWDEILEGGLAPNATVMSWRGEEGGIAAAKQNHDAIMTPGEFCYFDHAQSKNEDSLNIGGYLPLRQVYSYNPLPVSLSADEQKYIKGVQANVWTEYMANTKKVEYMIFPRLSALSEVAWSMPQQKDWPSFEKRLQIQLMRYKLWGFNYNMTGE